MKSREISRSKIGPFSLACTDPYIGIGWENQSTSSVVTKNSRPTSITLIRRTLIVGIIRNDSSGM